MKILVTGGCGFIGSNFIDYVLNKKCYADVELLLNIDSLTYAGRLSNTWKSLGRIKNTGLKI
jgi:dTDP-glucose 4,6-dehydratase